MPRNSIHTARCPYCATVTKVIGFDAPGPSITSCPHFLALLSNHKIRFGAEVEAEEVEAGGDVINQRETENEK